MSSPLFSVQAGCAVAFAPRKDPALVLKRLAALPKLAGVTPASQLEVRPSPEMVSSGIREIDALTGGLPRGCLSEIWGSASSGRTSVLLAALAAATRREEVCALVDATDALDAVSAAAAGVDLERLLWIRCGKTGVGPRASGVGPQISDSRPQISDLKSEVRRPRSELSSRLCASPICFCKVEALAWWRLISVMYLTLRHGECRWLPGFVSSVPSSPHPQCFWWWPRSPARRLALLC